MSALYHLSPKNISKIDIDSIVESIKIDINNLLAQSDPMTLSEKLLNNRVKSPFHSGGRMGFLNFEIVVKVSLYPFW